MRYNLAVMTAPRAKEKPPRNRPKAATRRLPKDAVTLLVVLRAKEGQEPALEKELRALVAPTRQETGCLGYTLHRSTEQPGVFLLHEVWASRDDHARHAQTPHFQRWNARKDAVLASRDASFWKQIV